MRTIEFEIRGRNTNAKHYASNLRQQAVEQANENVLILCRAALSYFKSARTR